MSSKEDRYSTRKRVEREAGEPVPPVRIEPDYIAVLCSDLHFSLRPPVARSVEPNWLATMAGYCGQLGGLAAGHSNTPGNPLPVICAGDVFDRWNAPAELINFALTYLPRMYAIPGQHDLPHHSYEDIRKSAYWTLVEAGKIVNLEPGKPVGVGPMQLWGFPWGTPVEPCPETAHLGIDVAVVHSYIWTAETGYEEASKESRLGNWLERLEGFDVAVFGDNHKGFMKTMNLKTHLKRSMALLNCGGFMRRKSDERDYQPTVGLLRSNGSITRYKLDVSGDKFLDTEDIPKSLRDNGIGMETFIEELSALGDAAIDFSEAVHRLLEREKVSPAVKKIVLASLEGVN